MRSLLLLLFVSVGLLSHAQSGDSAAYVLVLGVAQDGGYPHAGCTKKCCNAAWNGDKQPRYVTSIALVDPKTHKWWLFEATPDITAQLNYFRKLTGAAYNMLPDGIFITHAHIGHYTGLMQLGREVMNTKSVPVYVLPRLKHFLEGNGPWSQLVSLQNIQLKDAELLAIEKGKVPSGQMRYNLTDNVGVFAFTVPHRDEFSETAGFEIIAGRKKYLFIPDINKWEKWETDVVNIVNSVDVALLDGTFYKGDELPGRSMSEVPHPFVSETIRLFTDKSVPYPAAQLRAKLHFIHFNHTNPLLWDSVKQKEVLDMGFFLAEQGQKL